MQVSKLMQEGARRCLRRAFLLISLIAFASAGCSRKPDRLTNEVYVWQRLWTPAVTAAIAESKSHFATYAALAGEIVWTRKGPRFARAEVDFAALREAKVKVSLALRIGPYGGPFLPDDAAAKFIREKVLAVLHEAVAAGVTLRELQIDFDSAQSKLAGYRVWLEMIQAAAGKVPVSITVLPSWLGEPEFRNLAKQAGGFILQVHSVQMPLGKGLHPRIFDEPVAVRWAQLADDLGLPYRVALPTYSSQIISDASGKIVRIASEDGPASVLTGGTSQIVRTDAREVALFLKTTLKNRPRHLRGYLWYRLPLTTDRMNWRWQTLAALLENRPLQTKLTVQNEQGDFAIENQGNLDADLPASVTASWNNARLLAADALPGWTWKSEPERIVFRPDAEMLGDRLPPGGKVAIGWLRLDSPEVIHAQIP